MFHRSSVVFQNLVLHSNVAGRNWVKESGVIQDIFNVKIQELFLQVSSFTLPSLTVTPPDTGGVTDREGAIILKKVVLNTNIKCFHHYFGNQKLKSLTFHL